MHPPRRRTDVFGDGGRKRYDVVLSDFFDFFDACDIECTAFPDIARGIGRYDPRPRHGLGCGRFD
jgi:hypothetical protein